MVAQTPLSRKIFFPYMHSTYTKVKIPNQLFKAFSGVLFMIHVITHLFHIFSLIYMLCKSYASIWIKDMKKLLPFSLQLWENSCVSGIAKEHYSKVTLYRFCQKIPVIALVLSKYNVTNKNQFLFLYAFFWKQLIC